MHTRLSCKFTNHLHSPKSFHINSCSRLRPYSWDEICPRLRHFHAHLLSSKPADLRTAFSVPIGMSSPGFARHGQNIRLRRMLEVPMTTGCSDVLQPSDSIRRIKSRTLTDISLQPIAMIGPGRQRRLSNQSRLRRATRQTPYQGILLLLLVSLCSADPPLAQAIKRPGLGVVVGIGQNQ